MKKLAIIALILLMTAFAAAEELDLSKYEAYTGEPVENSAAIIQEIMDANVERDVVTTHGGIYSAVYIPSEENGNETMRFVRGEAISIIDGMEVRRITEEPDVEIYIAQGVAYMIENGAIFTMPVESLPVTLAPLDDFVFVYDETEHVLATRSWENGQVVLARADNMWLEYFLDEAGVICVIKTYVGEEAPACTGYISVEAVDEIEVPSFILREAKK